MIRRILFVAIALAGSSWGASRALAVTARDLGSRLVIDGYTTDFTDDESVFGFNEAEDALEEPINDSKWGSNDDLNQIRITWDARNLYLAGEGRIWDNNMMLFIDSVPSLGLSDLTAVNSWRRNIYFDTTSVAAGGGFGPDLFAATWDRNTSPRLIIRDGERHVLDREVSSGLYSASATFDQGNNGRSMEVAIPWRTVFLGPVGLGTRDTVMTVDGVRDTIHIFPPGTKLKLCGFITAGGDGTGGPDSGPDNTRGLSNDSGVAAYLDNWAIIDLDRLDDTGLGRGGPDGVADWGVEPRSRVSFRFRPPINADLNFGLSEVNLDRPAFRPDAGEHVGFKVVLTPTPDPTNDFVQIFKMPLSARVYDMRGRLVRTILDHQSRFALAMEDAVLDRWDGRDDNGTIVPPGIYILRTTIDENISRATRPFVVVR